MDEDIIFMVLNLKSYKVMLYIGFTRHHKLILYKINSVFFPSKTTRSYFSNNTWYLKLRSHSFAGKIISFKNKKINFWYLIVS